MVKQKKKNWKKIDARDVEEALEDDRLTKKLAKVPAEDLFSLDTLGSTAGLSRSTQKELKKAKEQGPKQRRYSPQELKKVAKAGTLLKNRSMMAEKRANGAPPPPKVFDLWGEPLAKAPQSEPAVHPERTARKPKLLPQKVPGTMHQRVSKAPAVVVAHEGQSVNPADEAFEELACTEAAVQLEKEREAKERVRANRPIFHTLLEHYSHEEIKAMDGATQLAKFQALTRGASGASENRNGDEQTVLSKKLKGRKTKAERNKQRRAQLNRQAFAAEQKEKQFLKSIGTVGSLLDDIANEEEEGQARKEYRATLKSQEEVEERTKGVIPKNRRIGKHKYREAAKELPLVEDGGKTGLRQVKMVGSALNDRVQSIYRQGLLEMKPEATREFHRGVKKIIRKRDKNRKFTNSLLRDGSLLLS